jgi:hypothetical protein
VIEENYTFSPTAFENGILHNAAGEPVLVNCSQKYRTCLKQQRCLVWRLLSRRRFRDLDGTVTRTFATS